MNNNFERYHCQMALPEFGESSQQLLQNARVLIVGAGGLGCPSAQYLAAAGVGTIGIADDDELSLSNLHRQILYTPEDIGSLKVEVASKRLHQQNPDIEIVPRNLRVTSSNVMDLIADYDLIVEGTDNLETKCLLNDACVLSGKPLVYGAIYQFEGQISIWNAPKKDGTYSPNYRDVFPELEKANVPNCADGGVIPSLAGIVGCMQANEVIKYLTGSEKLLAGKLWTINVQNGRTHIVNLKKRPENNITKLPESVETITFDEFQKEHRQKDFELIDVRTESEHQHHNIGGKNIPLEELQKRADALSLSAPVVCYCESGNRSVSAARLIKNKYPEATVYSLKGGIEQTRKL